MITEQDRQAVAVQLLSDPRFLDILRFLKDETIRQWVNGGGDMTAREALFRDVQAVGRLENRLQALAQNKTLDARKADEKERRAGPLKRS